MVNVTVTGVLRRPATFRCTARELVDFMAWYEAAGFLVTYRVRPVE